MLTEAEVDRLLDELSQRFGFRLQALERRQLVDDPPADVASFTDAVFIAEGMSPTAADRHQYGQVRDTVAEAFQRAQGRDAADALALDSRLPSLIGLSLDERKRAHEMEVKLEVITALSEFLRSHPEDWVFEGMSPSEEDAARRRMQEFHSDEGPFRFHLFTKEHDLFWGNGCDVIVRKKSGEQLHD